MDAAEFEKFLARGIPRRAERFVARGIWREPAAIEASRAVYARVLPAGVATPHQHLCHLVDEATGARVGETWYSSEEEGGVVQFWIEWIWIEPEFRRRGYATAALRLLEEEAHRRGAPRIGLDVWTDNPAALELYQKLGYSPANMSMVKRIEPSR